MDVMRWKILLSACLFLLASSASAEPNTTVVSTPVMSPTVTPNSTAVVSPTLTPNTTAVVSPTTTPSPSPPNSGRPTWNFTNSDGTLCILMRGYIDVVVKFLVNSTDTQYQTKYIRVPDVTADNSSYCKNRVGTTSRYRADLTLAWPEEDPNYYLSFIFEEDTAKGHQLWKMEQIKITFNTLNNSVFANYTDISEYPKVNASSKEQDFFVNEFQRSYRCDSQKTTKLPVSTNTSGTIESVNIRMTDWRVQAFEFRNNEDDFGQPRRCQADLNKKNTKVVPIVVGSALGVVVVIVVVIYLIGRILNQRPASGSYEPLS